MGLSLTEQETTINIMRSDDKASIYTSDSTMITKLDKLVASSEYWEMEEEIYDSNHELVGKRYACPKKLISFRSAIVTRELSDEQRIAAAERFREYHKKRREAEE